MNLSGAGVVATSDNKAEAQQLLEWLATDGQEAFIGGNHEYPVNPDVAPDDGRRGFGDFKPMPIDAEAYGALQRRRDRAARRGRLRVVTGDPSGARHAASAAHRRQPAAGRPVGSAWSWSLLLVAAVVAAPVLAVVVDGAAGAGDAALPARPRARWSSPRCCCCSASRVGTLVVGGGLAWLVTAYRFPLPRRAGLAAGAAAGDAGLHPRLRLPLDLRRRPGRCSGWLRDVLGDGLWVPDGARRCRAAVVVMTLTLYPYVYLMARAAFARAVARRRTTPRARSARRGRGRCCTVVLPLARPSLAAGLALVMMEVLTDFATVQYFGVQTVSVGVYLHWKGSYDFHAATQLSVLVLLFAVGGAGGGAAAARPRRATPSRAAAAAGSSRCGSPAGAAGRPRWPACWRSSPAFLLPVAPAGRVGGRRGA